MDVVGLAPLRVGSLVWHQEPAGVWLTVICKATFRLCPGESQLAADQEIVRAEDEHAGGDAAKSLHAPSDLVPRKTRADVMLVGHAYAPRGEVVRSLVARLCVGALDKEIEVVGERAWTRDGQLREAARFGRMALVHERAAGGPGTSNPLGVRTGAAAQPDVNGVVVLPNLQPVGATPESRDQVIPPVGFGPVPAAFPDRRKRLGRHGAGRAEARLLDAPFPEDFDFGYFNAAPPDQQLPLLRDGERVVLHNLHRDHPRLITALPASRPRAFAERAGAAAGEVDLRCDTLWIDTDRAICTLTWRGQISLATRDEVGRVLIALEDPDACLLYEDVLALAGPPPAPPVLATSRIPAFQPPGGALPFVGGPPRRAPASTMAILPGKPAATGPSWLGAAAPPAPTPAAPRFGEPPPMPPPAGSARRGTAVFEVSAPPLAAAPAPMPFRARTAVELIWADAGAVPRLRRVFAHLFRDRAQHAEGDREDDAIVARVLASERPCDASGLEDVMAGAVDADGRFRPPLVVVAGELRFPFDDADAHVQRLLLERRAYQRRALLGGNQIRALLTLPGAEDACPVYLAEALSQVLPMYAAFDARIAAEAHVAQDQAEVCPVALRVVALGRAVPAVQRPARPRATARLPASSRETS